MLTFMKLIEFIRSEKPDYVNGKVNKEKINQVIDLLLENPYSKEFEEKNINNLLMLNDNFLIFFVWRFENPHNFPYRNFEEDKFGVQYAYGDDYCFVPMRESDNRKVIHNYFYQSVMNESIPLTFLLSSHGIMEKNGTIGDYIMLKIYMDYIYTFHQYESFSSIVMQPESFRKFLSMIKSYKLTHFDKLFDV
jgi:hypothetical protein